MKKFVTSFLLFTGLAVVSAGFFCSFIGNKAFAETVWADDSVDELIIKQYDTKAIEKEFLPELPESLKNESGKTSSIPNVKYSEPKQTQQSTTKSYSQPKLQTGVTKTSQAKSERDKVVVKRGTKFYLRIEQPIDDSANIGSNVYFTSLYPEVNNYITIPKGTKFIGKVEDAHLPQISANGGLLVISVDRFVYKGRTYPIESKVVMVGDKRVYQNNIKGKHTYWKNVAKSAKPGVNFYKKSWGLTKKYAGEGVEIVLTPITFVGGVTVMAGNTIAAPAVALFAKGGRLFIKKGTKFEVRLIKDTEVYL